MLPLLDEAAAVDDDGDTAEAPPEDFALGCSAADSTSASSSLRRESTSALRESVVMAEHVMRVDVDGVISVAGDWLPESWLRDSLEAMGAATGAAWPAEREVCATAPATVMTVVEEDERSAEADEETSGVDVEDGAEPGLLRSCAARDRPPAAIPSATPVDDRGEGLFCLIALRLAERGELAWRAACSSRSPLVRLALLPCLCLGLPPKLGGWLRCVLFPEADRSRPTTAPPPMPGKDDSSMERQDSSLSLSSSPLKSKWHYVH